MNISTKADYLVFFCGLAMVFIGIWCYCSVRDRIFVFNMFGLSVKKEISDRENIKTLRLSDYKVKETIIDISDIYQMGTERDSKGKRIENDANKLICNRIEAQCKQFSNRSRERKSCFTGMAPIPYTILAGTYLTEGNTRRYFEYRKSNNSYYELRTKRKLLEKFQSIDAAFPEETDQNASEIVVAVSITKNILDKDLEQFSSMPVVRISVENPKDNLIESLPQLDTYTELIMKTFEKIKGKYLEIHVIHLVASVPSCVSVELGKKIYSSTNRIPSIIAYHYVTNSNPRYPFGIYVTEDNKGKLVE